MLVKIFVGFYLTPAGPLTWGALMPECYARPVPPYPGFLIRMGARGDYVRQIQTCLNSTNNAGLNPDGIFGPLTNAAVINYQRVHGLTPDGIVGPITWENLMRRCVGAGTTGTISRVADNTPIRISSGGVEFIGDIIKSTNESNPMVIIEDSQLLNNIIETEVIQEPPVIIRNSTEIEISEPLQVPMQQISSQVPMQPLPEVNISNLLMYCLLRKMKE